MVQGYQELAEVEVTGDVGVPACLVACGVLEKMRYDLLNSG
jgi:hypothetical protein